MQDIIENPTRYRKFLAAGLPLLAVVLSSFFDLPEGWANDAQSAIEGLLVVATPFFVWRFPNEG